MKMLKKTTALDRGRDQGDREARAGRDSGTEIVKVPLGIIQVPDIRCVFSKGTQAPLQMPATLLCYILTTQHVSLFHKLQQYHRRETWQLRKRKLAP